MKNGSNKVLSNFCAQPPSGCLLRPGKTSHITNFLLTPVPPLPAPSAWFTRPRSLPLGGLPGRPPAHCYFQLHILFYPLLRTSQDLKLLVGPRTEFLAHWSGCPRKARTAFLCNASQCLGMLSKSLLSEPVSERVVALSRGAARVLGDGQVRDGWQACSVGGEAQREIKMCRVPRPKTIRDFKIATAGHQTKSRALGGRGPWRLHWSLACEASSLLDTETLGDASGHVGPCYLEEPGDLTRRREKSRPMEETSHPPPTTPVPAPTPASFDQRWWPRSVVSMKWAVRGEDIGWVQYVLWGDRHF